MKDQCCFLCLSYDDAEYRDFMFEGKIKLAQHLATKHSKGELVSRILWLERRMSLAGRPLLRLPENVVPRERNNRR